MVKSKPLVKLVPPPPRGQAIWAVQGMIRASVLQTSWAASATVRPQSASPLAYSEADGVTLGSFSGLKTSVVTYIDKAAASGDLPPLADVAASVQEAIVDVLVDKTFAAVDATGARVVGGGGGVLAGVGGWGDGGCGG